jgi:type IV secretion system protein VirD4
VRRSPPGPERALSGVDAAIGAGAIALVASHVLHNPVHLAHPSRTWRILIVAGVLLLGSVLVVATRHRWHGPDPAGPHSGGPFNSGRAREGARREGRWANRRDLASLVIPQPGGARLTLGTWGRRLLAAEGRHSVLVVGPTQTLKTSGLAVPALLEWDGPVVATSVKTDLVRHTLAWRQQLGSAWVYDPTGCTGLPRSSWSPLAEAITWSGARRVAAAMVAAGRESGVSDADFWYATAGKLLAPLLFAAAVSGRTMGDVVRWVDTQEVEEVDGLLAGCGVEEARWAAEASWRREDRQRSSVYTTAETVLDAFADVADAGTRCDIDPGALLDGGSHTLYLCAPAHDQRRLRPLFAALVDSVVQAVYRKASLAGAPLEPALLLVLDEAAAIASLDDLDVVAATGAGQGIQLVTVWQDLAQVHARYGARAASVVNNHRAKLLLSGVSDPATLDHVSSLVGDGHEATSSVTTDGTGATSVTHARALRRLAPADALRRIRPGHALLVYGHLPPAPLRLRPWFADRVLSARARTPSAAPPSPSSSPSSWPKA